MRAEYSSLTRVRSSLDVDASEEEDEDNTNTNTNNTNNTNNKILWGSSSSRRRTPTQSAAKKGRSLSRVFLCSL